MAHWARNPRSTRSSARSWKPPDLEPNRPADKLTLLRRVTFDLTGLPPTPAEQAAFLADQSPDAYAKVVDRLLASPRYGERWAQHWLDLVRYSETEGFKKDTLRPDAHRYRDYVIRAFNDDLPYDRFIRQQLAGDELEPDNPDALIATGLIPLYPDDINASNMVQQRQEILDDITENTGLAFLGLTIGCAPVPRSQVRSHQAGRLLPLAGLLRRDFAERRRFDRLAGASEADYDKRDAAWEKATQADSRRHRYRTGRRAPGRPCKTPSRHTTRRRWRPSRRRPSKRTCLQKQLVGRGGGMDRVAIGSRLSTLPSRGAKAVRPADGGTGEVRYT